MNDTEIKMAPEQGWHANSWSVPYFLRKLKKGSFKIASKGIKHLGINNQRE